MPRRAHKRNASSQRKSKKIRKRETKEMNFDNIDFKAVLMMVLKYVPSRRNAAMVNKEWYNAVAQADSEENIYRINFDGYETKQEVRFVNKSQNVFITNKILILVHRNSYHLSYQYSNLNAVSRISASQTLHSSTTPR